MLTVLVLAALVAAYVGVIWLILVRPHSPTGRGRPHGSGWRNGPRPSRPCVLVSARPKWAKRVVH